MLSNARKMDPNDSAAFSYISLQKGSKPSAAEILNTKVTPKRKKIYLHVQKNDSTSKQIISNQSTVSASNMGLKSRRLTDSTARNLSEARRRIACRHRQSDGDKLAGIEDE